MRLKWLTLLWVAALSSRAVFAESAGAALPFKLYDGYTIVVTGSVGRLTKLNFIVDTGAVPTVVDKRIAHELKLVGKADQLLVFSATVRTERVVLPNVELGPLQAGPRPVLVEDLSLFSQALGTPIDGMIGLDILGQSNFTLDYASKQIVFGRFEPSDTAETVPIEVNAAGYVTVEAAIQGQFMRLMVDTGTTDFILFGSHLHEQVTRMRVLGRKPMSNAGGGFELQRAELLDATLGLVSLRGQHVSIMEVTPGTPRDLDGLLGVRSLGTTRLAFDFNRKLMTWESRGAARQVAIEARNCGVAASLASANRTADPPRP